MLGHLWGQKSSKINWAKTWTALHLCSLSCSFLPSQQVRVVLQAAANLTTRFANHPSPQRKNEEEHAKRKFKDMVHDSASIIHVPNCQSALENFTCHDGCKLSAPARELPWFCHGLLSTWFVPSEIALPLGIIMTTFTHSPRLQLEICTTVYLCMIDCCLFRVSIQDIPRPLKNMGHIGHLSKPGPHGQLYAAPAW